MQIRRLWHETIGVQGEGHVYTQMNEHWFRAKAAHKHASCFLPLVSCSLPGKKNMENAFDIDTRPTVKKRQLTLSKVHI